MKLGIELVALSGEETGIQGQLPDEAVFSAFDREQGLVVGRAHIVPFGDIAEVGYEVAPNLRGRGLGTEICKLVTEVAMAGYSQVIALVEVDNIASQIVLARNGYARVSEMGEAVVYSLGVLEF